MAFARLRPSQLARARRLARTFAAAPGETIPGININKTGSDPVAQEDSEYPSWVSDLADARTTLTELRRTWAARDNTDDDYDFDAELLTKLVHHESRAKIRGRNNAAGTFR